MSPFRILTDTNVLLDLIMRREPWLTEAHPMWNARDAGYLEACIPASVLTDLFYICRKQIGVSGAKTAIGMCITRFTILTLDRTIIEAANALPGNDFEDNVQIACATAAHLDCIVTRNTADVNYSPVVALAPPDVVKRLPAP